MSLGAAQQGAPDLVRIHLDVGLRVEGGGVSGNPLVRVTSVIQFVDISTMAVSHSGRGRGQQGTVDTTGTSVQSEYCLAPPSDSVSL